MTPTFSWLGLPDHGASAQGHGEHVQDQQHNTDRVRDLDHGLRYSGGLMIRASSTIKVHHTYGARSSHTW